MSCKDIVQFFQSRDHWPSIGKREVRGKIKQWHQDKGPLLHAWMRNNQIRRIHNLSVEQQEVQINDPRPLVAHAHPAHGFLNAQQSVQHAVGRPLVRATQTRHLVHEPGLVADVLRLGAIDRRTCFQPNLIQVGQQLSGPKQVSCGMAKVRAQADVRDYREAMRDNASRSRSSPTVKAMRK